MTTFTLPGCEEPRVEVERLSFGMMDYVTEMSIFNDAIRQCDKIIEACSKILQNKPLIKQMKSDKAKDIINPVYKAEEDLYLDLSFSTEDIKSFFVRIWEAIKGFFKKIYNWLFGFKATTRRYFASLDKDLTHQLDFLELLLKNAKGSDISHIVAVDKVKETKITFNHHVELDGNVQDMARNLGTIFDNLCLYVNDPERNSNRKLLEMEKNTDDMSFRTALGVTITSNEREPLSPSRIEVQKISNLYRTESSTIENIDFDLNVSGVRTLINCIESYKYISHAAIRLDDTFTAIQNSYDDLEKGLKEVMSDKSMDYTVASSRTAALVTAKDHIAKSKALIEAFVAVYNTEVKNVAQIVKALKDHYHK